MAAAARPRLACAMTLTFGECAENHVGNQQLGEIAEAGFGIAELTVARDALLAQGHPAELLELGRGAAVLVLRGGLAALGVDAHALYVEHDALDVDTKALMYRRVVNKKARHNLCYDDMSQQADYAAGKGTVVAFADVPLLSAVRAALPAGLKLGSKAAALKCELNKYYDPSCCGIGYHGDTERKRVVAIRLGVSIPLVFGWWHRHQPVGEKHVLSLHHGDMYVMSEKATGFDWKRSSVHTLRHAAGCEKYTGLRSDPPIEKRALAAGVPSAATGVACAVARELRATPLPERSRLLALLQTLESAAIDVDALAASGVAKLVKTLRTRSDVPVMAALATELFASWKLVAKEAGVVKTGQSQKKRPKVER
jgi:alkylated DNA repair dioxygenase AlkB